MVGRVVGKGHDSAAKISHVVLHARLIGIIENLLDEIHRRFGARMDLFAEIALDQFSQPLFTLNRFGLEHLVLSLSERQPRVDLCHGHLRYNATVSFVAQHHQNIP